MKALTPQKAYERLSKDYDRIVDHDESDTRRATHPETLERIIDALKPPTHPDLNQGANDAIEQARQNFMDVPEDAADRFRLWLVEPRNGGNSPLYDLALEYLEGLEDGQ